MAIKPELRRLKGDYGYPHIDDSNGEIEKPGDYPQSKIKNEFHRNARAWLKTVNQLLGWEADTGRGTASGVSVNRSGYHSSGEVTGIFWQPGSVYGIYIKISGDAPSMKRASPSGVTIMYRVTTKANKFQELGNEFADWDLTAGEMANTIRNIFQRRRASAATGDSATAANGNASAQLSRPPRLPDDLDVQDAWL